MPSPSQVCKDGDSFENHYADIANQVDTIRSKLYCGAGTIECIECGDRIPDERRAVLPGVRTCIVCQTEIES